MQRQLQELVGTNMQTLGIFSLELDMPKSIVREQ